MDVKAFIKDICAQRRYCGQIVHVREIAPRQARYAQPLHEVPGPLLSVLRRQNIHQLYTHQAQAFDAMADGKDIVVVTSTASGKTLCYNLPVIEHLMREPLAKALYLFPTKALAQDQFGLLRRLAGEEELIEFLRPAVYDGDTPSHARSAIRAKANVILTNPDMRHTGILPYHGRWHQFLRDLKFVVIDELHTYRGIFGSHVAGVLRRLLRLCSHYGSSPTIATCSATIANPLELAQKLTSRQMTLIDDDGAPRGRKYFAMWNPPLIDSPDSAPMTRRSANVESVEILVDLMRRRAQTIVFGKARVVVELIHKYACEALSGTGVPPVSSGVAGVPSARRRVRTDASPPADSCPGQGKETHGQDAHATEDLAKRIRPYRGGYLPNERREIEQALFSGQLLAVTTTNALELGIDVGSMDAAILVGFPGTICSTWQQAGRAGRSSQESLAILVAYNEPIDQYLMRHPEYLFGAPHEHGVIDPANPHILHAQLCCAAFEKPLSAADEQLFGPVSTEVVRIMAQEGELKEIDRRFYWPKSEIPSKSTGLRMVGNDTFSIVDSSAGPEHGRGAGPKVIGNVDSISAPELVYPGAIYLHEARSYLVKTLDLDAKIATVAPATVDYYTQPVLASSCRLGDPAQSRQYHDGPLCFGPADVTWQTTAFRKIKYYTMEMIGQGNPDLPAQTLATAGAWWTPSEGMRNGIKHAGHNPIEAMLAVRNLMLAALPAIAMCDRRDISGMVDSSNLGEPTIFIYDRYPGGMGFALRGYELIDQWLELAGQLVRECPCDGGCPSCVGLANLRPPLHQDPDLAGGCPLPNKDAGIMLLEMIRRN
jgi:DEAD/DEAH box helicase domain-containing protein